MLSLCEHGHFFFSKFCVAWCKLPSPPPLELPSTKNQSGNRIFWLYDGNDRFNYESLNSDKNIIKVLYTILSLDKNHYFGAYAIKPMKVDIS